MSSLLDLFGPLASASMNKAPASTTEVSIPVKRTPVKSAGQIMYETSHSNLVKEPEPTLTQAIFPRASSADNVIEGNLLTAPDLTSLPGRAIMSMHRSPDESYLHALARTDGAYEGDTFAGGLANSLEMIGRDPFNAIQGPLESLGKKAYAGVAERVARVIDATNPEVTMKTGFIPPTPIPTKTIPAPPEFGHPEGYEILNHEWYPESARRASKELEDKGIPRFIPGPLRSGFEGKTVLNPIHRVHPETPEGIEWAEKGGSPNPTILYSAGKPTNNPYYSMKVMDFEPANGKYVNVGKLINPETGALEGYTSSKWAGPSNVQARTYLEHSLPDPNSENADFLYRNILRDNIRKGIIHENNLPSGYKTLAQLEDYLYAPQMSKTGLYQKGQFSPHDALRMLYETGVPEAQGVIQELVSFAKKPATLDMKGNNWTYYGDLMGVHPHQWQRDQIADAISTGHDEFIFLNQSDHGGAVHALTDEELINREPWKSSDVHVQWNPGLLKSPYGLGPINLKDHRVLQSLPFAGLGALGLGAANDRQ